MHHRDTETDLPADEFGRAQGRLVVIEDANGDKQAVLVPVDVSQVVGERFRGAVYGEMGRGGGVSSWGERSGTPRISLDVGMKMRARGVI